MTTETAAHICRLQEQIEVERSTADCFRYLQDFSTVEQWDPGVSRASKLTPGAVRTGSEFKVILKFLGRSVSMRYRLLRLEPGRELVLEGAGPGFTVRDTIRLEPLAAARTRIAYSAQVEFAALPALLRPAVNAVLRRGGRAAMDGLRRALEPTSQCPELSLSSRLADRLIGQGMWNFTERGYRQMADKSLSEFMDGKTVLITGPTSGLGLAAAQLLARLGARLILVGRDAGRLNQAVTAIADFAGTDPAAISVHEADLLCQVDRVRLLRALHESLSDGLDVLINNAGALFEARQDTAEQLERAFVINLMAPYELTTGLMAPLRRAGGRVINMASGGLYTQALQMDDLQYRQTPYNGAKAYARAKRGLVAMTEHWAETESAVQFHAVHPGWAATPGVAEALPDFNRRLRPYLRDARMGADTAVWLASSSAVAASSGGFWFDRQPRSTAWLPGTAHSPEQVQQLASWLARHAAA